MSTTSSQHRSPSSRRRTPRARAVLGVVLLCVAGILLAAGPAQATVSIARAELSGSSLRLEGTASPNRTITVDGQAMGTSESSGRFRIERNPYTPPADCTVDVNDGSTTPRTATLSGCTVSSPPPPPPSGPAAPAPLAPAEGASVTVPLTLSWSQVLDPGSLNGGYNWQIATSSAFTTLVVRDSTRPSETQDTVGGLAAGTYFWRVEAVDGNLDRSPWSATRSFMVTGSGTGALPAPTLAPLPFGAHYFPMESWPFSWSPVTGAASYTVEVSDDPAFPSPPDVRSDNEPDTTSGFTFDHTLIGTWHLRVYAVDANGVAGAPSNAQTFRISYEAPIGPPPAPLSPPEGATLQLPVVLDWSDVENPQNRGYHVEIATDADFRNQEVLVPFRSESAVTLVDLSAGTKFWRVRHSEGDASPTTAAFTDWSAVRTFTVAGGEPAVTSVSLLGRTRAFSGTEQVGELQLSAVAPTGGAVVSLASSHPGAAPVPASVTIPAGSASAQFRFHYGHVTTPTPVTVTATLGRSTAQVAVTVDPSELKEVGPSPNSITGGASGGAMIALNGSAPPEGAVVTLTSSSPRARPPASVTLAAGAFFGPFSIETDAVGTTTPVTITAEWQGKRVEHQLTLLPGVPPETWTLERTTVTGSEGTTGRVSIAQVQSTDTSFTLTSSHPEVARASSTVTIPAGSPHVGVIISTTPPAAPTTVTFSLSGGGVTLTAALTVNPVPAAPLPAPTLLAPAEGARWAPNVTQRFDWSDVSGAASYVVQVSSSSAFSTIALQRTVTVSEASLSFSSEGTRYWRVRAADAGGNPGAWSAVRSFRVRR